MQEQKPSHSIHVGVVASVCTLIGMAIGGLTSWQLYSLKDHPTVTEPSELSGPPVTRATPPIAPSPPVKPPVTAAKPEPNVPFQTVKVYWLKDDSESLDWQLVPSPIQIKSNVGTPLEAAFHSLLAGPADPTVATTIPVGTQLLSVQIKNNGVHIDLSDEFTSGGGTASMSGRLGQIIYTATTLRPNTQVWIYVEGKPLKYLGGGGLEVSQPLTRQSFESELAL